MRLFFLYLLFICNVQQLIAQTDDLFQFYADKRPQENRQQPSYFIIEYKGVLPSSIKPDRQLSGDLIILPERQAAMLSPFQIVRMAPADDNWKLSRPGLLKENRKEDNFILSGKDLSSLIKVLAFNRSGISILKIDTASRSVVVKADQGVVKDLIADAVITFLDIQRSAAPEVAIIGYDRSFHNNNELAEKIPAADGNGIVVGVKEQKMNEEDLDLYRRVLSSSIAASTVSNHATVISSIIGGAGNSFFDGLGIAGNCRFFPSSYSDLFPDNLSILNTAGVTVQNHSYGTIIQSFYGAEAVSYDAQSQHSPILHVFSAGNQGIAAANDGRYAGIAGYGNITGNFKAAKNIITIGAIDNKGNIAAESSAGPLYDGRIAPQLIALGPNGTSDAAAMVSGTVAVLQQVYRDSNQSRLPSTPLIKSVLYTSADDVHQPGIDYKTGYGLLNSYKAVRLLQQQTYVTGEVSSGLDWSQIIQVPDNASKLKLTLCWNDEAGTLNNFYALVNDLDIELVELKTGNSFLPWVLNSSPHKDSLAKTPVRSRDSLNTAEQISVHLPSSGTYKMIVRSRKPLAYTVPFAVAWYIDTLNTFRFTAPIQSGELNRAENPSVNIKWVAEPRTNEAAANLSVSFDRGNTWKQIAEGIKLAGRSFAWTIPDTNSVATLRMSTDFGDFISNDFLISDLTRPQLDFVCLDSFRLSWNKHVYANSYKLFALTDSSHLKNIAVTNDTFIVVDCKRSSSLVYAVQPVLNNGLSATRSIAMNIELQGVQCFYRTLNYGLEDGNRLRLILELSATDAVDSIFFEQLSADGVPLQITGAAKALPGKLLYSTTTDEVFPGTVHFRARIRLKNKATVHTETVEILTSGRNTFLFYPNPVPRSVSLSYVIKQGVSPDCRLQIFDVYGRMVRQHLALPSTIDVSDLVTGVYLFKISDRAGKQLSVNRIVVY